MTALPAHQLIKDAQGQPVFVQIPVEEWSKFVQDFERMQTLLVFKKRFQSAFKEVREIRSGKKQAVTLSAFLHEL